ncbi:MarR family winged helix-turn-helix transcriptional regulator [Mucilaginibacter sp. AW1-3]
MNDQNLLLASELRSVVIRLYKKLRKKSVSAEKLSLTERSTIALIYNNGTMLASELALAEKITTQSMSQVINHLFELELISKTPSETDKRKVLISLTEAGKEVINKARTEKDEWLSDAIADALTPEEHDTLTKALGALTKLVDFD